MSSQVSQLVSFVPASALVVVAHPDDAEFMAAGTVAYWAGEGARVTYAVVTKGDKGSDDPAMTPSRLTAIREAEQRAAAAVLGVADVVFLGYPDGYLQHTLELRRDLTRLIRTCRPEVVITFDPSNRFVGDSYVNHPDHRTTGDATIDAIFPSARDRLTFPELLIDGLEPHKVAQLWMGFTDHTTVWVDITSTMELKKQALLAHPSQLGEWAAGFAEQFGAEAGRAAGVRFAEGFRRIIFDQPFEGRAPEFAGTDDSPK